MTLSRTLALGAVGAGVVAVAAADVVTLMDPTPLTYAIEAVAGGGTIALADYLTDFED